MDQVTVQQWVTDYERAWRSSGTEQLGELFTPGVSYLPSPWADPLQGLDALASFWDAERDGPDEAFEMTSEIVAVDGDTAVVRVQVEYGPPARSRWRDLWLLRFADDEHCSWFEEWPFPPSQPDGH